jgi:ATP-dependent Clp protease protease subunit
MLKQLDIFWGEKLNDVKNTYAPVVIEKEGQHERVWDLPSRLMRDRNIFLNSEVNQQTVMSLIMQILILSGEDEEAPIYFYINSPGGSVMDGLALFDVMRAVPNKIITICVGQAASMGSFLLSAGDKRFALPNSRLMYHQVMSGIPGGTQYLDMKIAVDETEKLYNKLNEYLSEFTGGKISVEEMKKKTERDWWLSPEEAVEIGFIDGVIKSLNDEQLKNI